jgi:hypothetical protein
MKKRRRRKCLHCGGLYSPDPRTRDRQRFCSDPDCQRESKRLSQQRWFKKAENRDYFKGPEQVERNRVWRREHPGYWKKPPLTKEPLQEESETQPVEDKEDRSSFIFDALQDELMTQPVLLVGLISTLAGSALQDDIAPFIRGVQARGQQILGMRPESQPKGEQYVQATPSSRPFAPSAGAVQLDRSSSGP